MKKKRILSLVLVVAMLFGFTSFFPNTILDDSQGIVASAESVQDLLSYKTTDVLGTWNGTYIGHSSSNLLVDRRLMIKIYSCSSSGDIEGYAFIDEGTNGYYKFSGTVDLPSGEIKFKGQQWIGNPSNFGFASFQGFILYNENNHSLKISGNVDDNDVKLLSLNKMSDDYSISLGNAEAIPRDWVGEYDGYSGDITVRRNYQFHIDSIDDDGTIKGTAALSPSSKADSSLGANGSYYYSGKVDLASGLISLQGYEWIKYPDNNNINWSFASLSGCLCIGQNRIIGSSERGIWDMHCLNNNEGTPVTTNTTVNFSYGNYNEPVRNYSFKYNDNWLLKEATTESANMAKFTSNLAVAAYEKESVVSCLKQMGFDNSSIQTFGSYDFMPTYEDNDRVAFTIAYKKVNGKNVFVVPIRGTHGNCEWLSDFNLGTGQNHEGFYRAAEKVKYALANSFANIGVKSKETIVVFTGHSRGAAVANILAGELCTVGIKSADEKINYVIPKKQVFGYTYACPAVSSDLKDSYTKLKNIYNYINPGDLIPTLPLSSWGYKRYGTTKTFKTDTDSYYSFQHKFYTFCKEKYEGMDSVNGVLSTLAAVVPTAQAYNKQTLQMVFEYVAISMMNDSSASIPVPKDILYEKLCQKYKINEVTQIATLFALLLDNVNPLTLGVALANLDELIDLFTGKSVAHAHMGETYVKWVEAWYGNTTNITHSFKDPVVVPPRIGSDGYTIHECKKCNYKTINNYTKFDITLLDNNMLRISGNNRYDTSAQIANQCYGYAETVVLASGTDYPDALAGIPLAQAYNAPILLTAKDSISKSVLDEITSLHAKTIIILGGKGAVGVNVETTLKNKGLTVLRIAGNNRFDTAAKVAEELNKKVKTDTVFFTYYNGFADALSVSHIAGIMGAPVLYVTKDGDLDEATKRYLDSVKTDIKQAYVIGGTGVISEKTRKSIASYIGIDVERVSGSNRYKTCIAINRRFNALLTGQDVYIATGKSFPDALAGGVLAAKTKSPLVLADGVLDKEQEEYFKEMNKAVVCIFGGVGAVSQSLVDQVLSLSK